MKWGIIMKAMKKVSALLIAVLLSVAIFAGCGGTGASDEDAIKEVVAQFEKSVQTQNIDDMLKCFDPDSSAEVQTVIDQASEFGMTKDEIASSFFAQLSSNPSSAKFTTENIVIDGETATADVTLNADDVEDSTSELTFKKIDGTWYIDGSGSGLA